jgi:hypothetical protein
MVLSSIIGSWGWQHPEWEKDVFYPDDLPKDWQLSYYSNEFDAVVVPASYWSTDGYGEDDWLDDVTDAFVFYIDWPFLQLTDQADYEKCAQYCQHLDKQMVAVLLNGAVWQTLTTDQQQWFKTVTKGFTVLQYNAGSEPGYAPVYDDQLPVSGNNILLLHSDSKESLRDLGGRLGSLLQGAAQGGTNIEHIVLSNEKVEINRLKELKTLITLLQG